MANAERNRRSAGYTRPNALYERMRMKAAAPPEPAPGDDPDGPPWSLVVLLRSPVLPDDALLRDAAERAFGTPADDLTLAGPLGELRVGDWTFDTEAGDAPYFDDPEAAADHVPELRLRAAVRDHAGWLRVDLSAGPADAPDAECAARVGRLLTALAADAVAIFRPATGQVGLFTPDAVAALSAGRTNDAFLPADTPVPIAGVRDDDPRMVAAEAEANRRFGEFVAALATRRPGETFAVKVPFEDEYGVEFMWVSVTSVDGGHVHGRLDNEPAFVRSVRLGQAVRVPRGTLNDWLYTRDGELNGGFTLKLLGDQLRPSDRRTGDAA